MPRYIDAEKAHIYLNRTACKQIRLIPTADVVSQEVYEQVKWERDVAITQLKSYGIGFGEKADVAEVKHGKWKEHFSFDKWHYDCPFCDFGFAIGMRQESPPNYCENCGAKMDGKESEGFSDV